MNNTEEITKLETAQKWEEPFKNLLDEIWYPGYSQQLAEEKPEEYQTEYYYFISLYDEPLPEEVVY